MSKKRVKILTYDSLIFESRLNMWLSSSKKNITDIRVALQNIIDSYNKTVPAYKKVYSLKVRETEFEKTPSKKIKRYYFYMVD